MSIFRKKCQYCGERIEKGKEITAEVKVPEFKYKVKRKFCSLEHLDLYKKYVKSIPIGNSCPYCKS